MTTRPALGRGLDALIPPSDPAPPRPVDTPQTLPIDQIEPNPLQPRSRMDPKALEELAASIREHGILQPLLVQRQTDGAYTLVAGERRWRAAQLAELTTVPVVITDFADNDLLTIALVENIQRQDLTPLEEAHAFQRLIEELTLTQEQVAKRVGKSRVAVTNSVRLLALPTEIRMSLAAGEISAGHARAILGAPSAEQQLRLWQRVRDRALTVRQTESAAKRLRLATSPPTIRREFPGDLLAQQRLQIALGTKVHLQRGRRGGKIVLSWYDDEQLEHIVNQILDTAADTQLVAPDRIDI